MSIYNSLINLADNLDKLGLRKKADTLDQIIARAAREKGFDDLMRLFDERGTGESKKTIFEPEVEGLEGEEEVVPIQRGLTQIPEEYEILTPLTDVDMPPAKKMDKDERMLALKERYKLIQKMKQEAEKEKEEEETEEKLEKEMLPGVEPALLETDEDESFEDEDGSADDDLLKKQLDEDEPGTLEKVMDFFKDNPEVLQKLLLFLA